MHNLYRLISVVAGLVLSGLAASGDALVSATAITMKTTLPFAYDGIQAPELLNEISPAVNLAKRIVWPSPADDTLMLKCYCLGKKFSDVFIVNDRVAGSMFTPPTNSVARDFSWDQMMQWDYVAYRVDAYTRYFDSPQWGVGDALRALRVSDKATEEGGKIEVLRIHHGHLEGTNLNQQTYRAPDGSTRRPTGAYFIMGMNPTDGVMLTMNVHGASTESQNRYPPVPADEWPELRQHSDVMWAMWTRFASGSSLNNFKWHFILTINNQETLKVIRRVLERKGVELTAWPGLWIGMDDADGLTLLGTPNGKSTGYFFVQHKLRLGNFYIQGVVVFMCKTTYGSPGLAFSIAHYPGTRRVARGGPSGNTPEEAVVAVFEELGSGAFKPPEEFPESPEDVRVPRSNAGARKQTFYKQFEEKTSKDGKNVIRRRIMN